MAQTSGTGGISSLAIGGIAAVVVIVGGVVLVQLGVFEGEDPSEGQALRPNSQAEVALSPATGRPVVVPGTDAAQAEAADGEQSSGAATSAGTDGVSDPGEDSAEAPDVAPAASEAAEPTEAAKAETAATETAAPEPEAEPSAEAPQEAGADVQTAGTAAEPQDTAQEGQTDTQAADPEDSQPVTETVTALAPPQLDLVRVDPDGAVVIAGRAVPGAAISVLLDGTVLEQASAQGSGEFVIFASILPSQQPRVISLLARLGEQEAASLDQFILAPAAPVPAPAPVPDVAEAPVSQPETVAETSTELASAAVETAGEEGGTVSAPEQETQVEPVQTAQASPEQTSDTGDAQETAPPVEADADGPAQPSEGATEQTSTEQIALNTTESDTAETAPDAEQNMGSNTAPNKAPTTSTAQSQGEEVVRAETEPAPEPQATSVAVLRAGADGVELVQPAAPVLGGKVALDTISYSDSGDVVLAGRARAGALVRAYVNNALAGEMPVGEDSRWGGALVGIDPGIYTLRLDEVDAADGAVLSRLETPFKREAPEVLQPPAQAPGTAPDQPVPLVRAVTVQKGDTLWAISQERYGSGFLYVRVFEANQDAIRDPDLIYPGQVFNLPE
ncbi:LysM peptidoglycan-binding domain-containing protein [Phaeobacter sp. QD34_3]|uniref:LysM peptidoglycan-binding domain-containing protein n=1 Tax=unclassified Phaeobacter TaxID=2621772 RepID=UPI00237FB4B9|nr:MULTISPECIES: LysM peptidoglycan-binding domain-containing protein [unclassified Phaeobacter]MDE4133230.1 LysM peptidoglycan-binding domain-containing protein [Phaeobacter sp. QD34_3]MDE4136983.1 LysM peptidoglycan-binding domain-containing protein [Phaeobacter sp. QD34_24]